MSLFDLQDVCIAIGSLATLDLPMVVDLIGIYVLKGPYHTLTTTNWFLQALSVIPRGSWGDVARRFTMIRWARNGIRIRHCTPTTCLQVLSLASAFQLREERSRNSESKLHEEIVMIREELLKKQKESDEKSKSCDTLRVELEEKSKSYDLLRQELQQLEEKYSLELTAGEHFLNSTMGKTLLMSTGEKAIEGYRASSAFRDEVLQ
ncbi:hypothetical protein F511_41472 [Dorcoceras hygrometricum]|uniref:Uncharacterized protein n=1 Tax=Dorcoceras hygrometricum TaxID=472368 RepID=A0A2Z7D9A5_9LAMI|nr:hypothetical protein F511_41472 [Dorcoceras hygrometricum]